MVVGSLNHDIVATVARWLAPGETLLAHSLSRGNGGKGGNQAIAAVRAGAPVTMVGAVGADAEGSAQSDELAAYGIDTSALLVSGQVPTSLALITVVPDGENTIVVTPGANDLLTGDRVAAVLDGLDPGDIAIVLAQSEIGGPGCEAAAIFAERVGARFVFSNGPVTAVSEQTWRVCDPVVVNVHEARDVLRSLGVAADRAETTEQIEEIELARAVRQATGARSVVVTLGSAGSVAGPVDPARAGADSAMTQTDGYARIAAVPAESVVDTTGAGDTYGGTLAAALALGASLIDACAAGSRAGAVAVGWPGARPPHDEVASSRGR